MMIIMIKLVIINIFMMITSRSQQLEAKTMTLRQMRPVTILYIIRNCQLTRGV